MQKPQQQPGSALFEQNKAFHRVRVAQGTWFWMNHITSHDDTGAHDHAYLELAFFMHGQAKHLTVRGSKVCRAGSVFIIPPGAWHGYVGCRNLEIYNCLLSPHLLQNELAWAAQDRDLRELLPPSRAYNPDLTELKVSARDLPALRAALESLQEAYHRSEGSKVEVLGRLLLLLNLLAESGKRIGSAPDRPLDIHPSVRRALQLFESDMSRAWTLGALATELHVNSSYLVRLFHANTGFAPMKYLANRRAELAATLLLSERIPVGEVGRRVGWGEPKQFARSFRQYYGVNAREYRREMQRQLGDKLVKYRSEAFYSEVLGDGNSWLAAQASLSSAIHHKPA